MSHPLQARVAAISRRASFLVREYGVRRFAAAALALLVSISMLDHLLRWHDPGLRWLASLTAIATIAAAFFYFAIPGFRVRRNLIDVARRIERRFPQFGERLSSAIAFLEQGEHDPTAGSSALRRSVIAEAEAIAADLDFGQALERPRILWWWLIPAGALALLVLLNPPAAKLALSRLALPWQELPWPRRHELEFASAPARLAAGDDFEVELRDRRGTLPDVVQIELRHYAPGGTRIEFHQMKRLGERMVYRLENVAHPFDYRATGGDDDTMGWTELEIVEPPKVVALTIDVQPPVYSGLPKREEGRV